MPSGNIVGFISHAMSPASSPATLDTRAGGSTPAETFHVYDFDASSDEYMDFYGVLNGYDGGGLTVKIVWMATSATANEVRWGAAFRRIADDAEDLDSSHSYDFNYVADTAPSAAGEISIAEITFTEGADMDSLSEGEPFVLRIMRDADHADDDMTGDAELLGVPLVIET